MIYLAILQLLRELSPTDIRISKIKIASAFEEQVVGFKKLNTGCKLIAIKTSFI